MYWNSAQTRISVTTCSSFEESSRFYFATNVMLFTVARMPGLTSLGFSPSGGIGCCSTNVTVNPSPAQAFCSFKVWMNRVRSKLTIPGLWPA